MVLKRERFKQLLAWKEKKNRKPLILRGARQVGKTTLVKQFGETYQNFIYLNLEKSDHANYFLKTDDIDQIINTIFLVNGIKLEQKNNTLLLIDEIQEVPKAIQLLRYFYEESPDLHVIAAGSLLEFALDKVASFPVGRVEFLYLNPFNFREYLLAIPNKSIVNELDTVPVENYAHDLLMKEFHQYAIIGGMPEIIKNFIESNDFTALPEIYESIWTSYKSDVEKYSKGSVSSKVLNHIINTAPFYLDERIKFQNFGNSNYKSREVGEAFRDLTSAKVIQLIYPTTAIEFPAIPDLKKSPRLQVLDTGLVNHTLRIAPDLILTEDLSESYKGSLLPHIITQEVISLQTFKSELPNFWVREKSQSSSELDLILSHRNMLIPIEFKSGKTGTLRSLHEFIDRSNHPYGIRMYGGEFNVIKTKTPKGKEYYLMNLPYYLGTKIYDYIELLLNDYKL
ncbi:DUF4143 domain-containing protein [Brumimicrobium glaciale]|uniref:DUF4143 domain-containing protein n=1 Tax=Brumimicrobium glaciale TaxID=200475 RepID=A0A4Q4KKW1_9FLAO|nr:AAA family ATPase [Brumimicrobium glaciale]RYM33530.1 DUF4143 domain-containing protein [Brumimicrobium glaciale]